MICCNHSLQKTGVNKIIEFCIMLHSGITREYLSHAMCYRLKSGDSKVVEKVKMTCFHWLTSLCFSAPTPHSKAKIYSLVTGREDLDVCFCLADGTLKETWSRLQAQLCTRETLSAFHLRVCMLEKAV